MCGVKLGVDVVGEWVKKHSSRLQGRDIVSPVGSLFRDVCLGGPWRSEVKANVIWADDAPRVVGRSLIRDMVAQITVVLLGNKPSLCCSGG